MLAFRDFALECIMYGSDISSDLRRGTMVDFGIGCALLMEQEIAAMGIDYCDSRCRLLLYEALRGLRRAVKVEGLNDQQVEDLFYNNAAAFDDG